MNALASVGDGTNTLHTWVYDDNNHLSVYKDLVANRHWRYQFDSIGRLALIHIFNAGGLWLGEANYSYDQRNNIDHLACWFGGQPYYQWYVYDAIAGQPETATYAKDNLPVRYSMATDRHLDYDYDGLNRLTTKTLNTTTPIITNYAYHLSARNQDTESRYQTTQVSVEIVGDIAYRYTYDTNGNITRIEKGERTGTNTAGNFADYRIYTYNGRGDLEQEHNIALNLSTRYVYDGYGNISFKVLFPYGGNSVTDLIERPVYTYTNGTWSHMLTDYNGQAITYDAIGNPLSYRGATLTWENGRQLASHTTEDIAVSYLYDADGLRTSKTVNGTRHDYYYLDGKLVYEKFGVHDILYYYDSYGTFAGLQYFPAGSNGVMYYAATNMRGDVIGLYDASGTLVVSYEYDAWGELLSVTDTSSNAIGAINPFRYRGYYYDIETGLYYLQSRYYDPETCRFINADNLVSTVGGEMLGNNPFIYCFNNPVNMLDLNGRWAIWNTIKSEAQKAWETIKTIAPKVGSSIVTAFQGLNFKAAFGTGLGVSADIGVANLSLLTKMDAQQIIINGFDGMDFGKETVNKVGIGIGPLNVSYQSGKYHSDLCPVYDQTDDPHSLFDECEYMVNYNPNQLETDLTFGIEVYCMIGLTLEVGYDYRRVYNEWIQLWEE